MAFPIQVDHVAEGLDNLITQFKDKPVITGLLTAYLTELNEVESALFELLQERGIYEAVGVQLEIIGALFGAEREGRNDEDYRSYILLRIAQLDDDGTTEVFMNNLRTAGNTDYVDFWEHEYGDVYAYMGAGFSSKLYSQLKNTVPAGTRLTILIDDEGDSLVLSELLYTGNDLQADVDGMGDTRDIEVDIDGLGTVRDLQVQTVSIDNGGRSYLPELEDTDLINPLAEIINRDYYSTTGNLVYEDASLMTDIEGNPLLWTGYTF